MELLTISTLTDSGNLWVGTEMGEREKATTAQPTITKVLKEPDVDQPLRVVQEEEVAAPRGRDKIGGEQAGSATLALTMQYRGLEQTIPLRLPADAIAMLTLEAQVREISLGQLLGTLIEAAMTRGLSQVLDNESFRGRAAIEQRRDWSDTGR